MNADYVFAVDVRLEPAVAGVALDPQRFETTLYREAGPPPGTDCYDRAVDAGGDGAAGGVSSAGADPSDTPPGGRDAGRLVAGTIADDWLFFRDNCWHGELADPAYFRRLTEDALGLPVDDVVFRELRTDREYLAALEAAVASNLELFNADTVEEALTKYLGSSIHVTDRE